MEVEKDNDLIRAALDLVQNGQDFALAIVTETWGSSPRQAGSFMLISQDGHIAGSVSGGCVEADVIMEAHEVMSNGVSKVLTFGVSDETAWVSGLSCGGTIKVFICSKKNIQKDLFSRIQRTEQTKKNISLVCNLDTGEVGETTRIVDNLTHKNITSNLIFITLLPKPRLFIVGAVQIAQHLISMAKEAGFDFIIIDPRSQFASEKRFPNAKIHIEWPDEALEKYSVNSNDALVTLTHDSKIDEAALGLALRLPFYCISSLGSNRTNAKRIKRLQKAGFSEVELARINAPAGLNIGAKTPAEIAISILAQLIERKRTIKSAK